LLITLLGHVVKSHFPAKSILDQKEGQSIAKPKKRNLANIVNVRFRWLPKVYMFYNTNVSVLLSSEKNFHLMFVF